MNDTASKFAVACIEATKQWHQRARAYEVAARALAQAQHELQLAERDLHELGRALAVTNGAPPHVPSPVAIDAPTESPADEVLRLMKEAAQTGMMP